MDKEVFTFNYKDGSNTATIDEITAELGSDLEGISPPKPTTYSMLSKMALYVVVFFIFLDKVLYNSPCKSAEKVSNWCQNRALFGVKQPAHADGNARNIVLLRVGVGVLRHA